MHLVIITSWGVVVTILNEVEIFSNIKHSIFMNSDQNEQN